MITCFDIGGSFIRHGTPRDDGSVPELGRAPTPRDDWDAFVSLLDACAGDGPVSIALAGAFDSRSGLADVANIPCLHGRRVEQDLETALGRPVRITNDADAFALAEAVEGVGRGRQIVFGIILGSGVGGGIVVEGRPLRGYGGVTGEWGHGPVLDPMSAGIPGLGPFPCGCGRSGCIDAVCSARGLERIDLLLSGEARSSRDITSAWHRGETTATAAIETYLTLTAAALSVIVNTIGPDVVAVGGGLSADGALIGEIDRRTRALALADYPEPLVRTGRFAAGGGLVGAAIAARDMGQVRTPRSF